MGIEAAVDTVVVAVVGKINRRDDRNVIAKMAARDDMGFLGHFFQVGSSGRREKCHEIMRIEAHLAEGQFDVFAGKIFIAEGIVIF